MKKNNKFIYKMLMLLVALFLFKSNVVKASDGFKYEGQFGYSYSNNIVKFKYYSSTANKISVIIEGLSTPVVLTESDNVWGGAVNGEGLFGKEYTLTIEDENGNIVENVLDPYGKYTNADGDKNVIYSGDDSDFTEWLDQKGSTKVLDKNKIIYGINIENFTKHSTWNGEESYRGKLLGLIESETNVYLTGYDYIKSLGVTYLELSMVNNVDIPFAIDNQIVSGSQIYAGELELKQVVNNYYLNNIGVIASFNYKKLSSQFIESLNSIDKTSYLDDNSDLDLTKEMTQEYINELLCYYARNYKLSGIKIDSLTNYPINFINKVISNLKSINENIIIYGDGTYTQSKEGYVGENTLGQVQELKLFNGSLSYGLVGNLMNAVDRGFLDGVFNDKNNESLKYALLSGVNNGQINYSNVEGISYKSQWDISNSYQLINYLGKREGLSIYDKLSIASIANDNIVKQKIILAYGLMMMSGGIPYIYSGEEFLVSYLDPEKSSTSICDQSNIFCYKTDEKSKIIDWSLLDKNNDVANAIKALINYRKSSNSVAQTEVKVIENNVKVYENKNMPGVIGIIRNYPNAPTREVEMVVAMFNFSNTQQEVSIEGEGWHGLYTYNSSLRDGETLILKPNSIYTEVKEKLPKISPIITLVIVVLIIGLLYSVNIMLNRKLMSKKGYEITDIKKKYRPFMKKNDKVAELDEKENKDENLENK